MFIGKSNISYKMMGRVGIVQSEVFCPVVLRNEVVSHCKSSEGFLGWSDLKHKQQTPLNCLLPLVIS